MKFSTIAMLSTAAASTYAFSIPQASTNLAVLPIALSISVFHASMASAFAIPRDLRAMLPDTNILRRDAASTTGDDKGDKGDKDDKKKHHHKHKKPSGNGGATITKKDVATAAPEKPAPTGKKEDTETGSHHHKHHHHKTATGAAEAGPTPL